LRENLGVRGRSLRRFFKDFWSLSPFKNAFYFLKGDFNSDIRFKIGKKKRKCRKAICGFTSYRKLANATPL